MNYFSRARSSFMRTLAASFECRASALLLALVLAFSPVAASARSLVVGTAPLPAALAVDLVERAPALLPPIETEIIAADRFADVGPLPGYGPSLFVPGLTCTGASSSAFINGRMVYTVTSTATLTCTGRTTLVDWLLVGGGATGGGHTGGGGGGGCVNTSTGYALAAGSYTITIGAGQTGGASAGTAGGTSSFGAISTAIGGGAGHTTDNGGDGCSGGGSGGDGATGSYTGGTGTGGNNGGGSNTVAGTHRCGGGGGGMTAAGVTCANNVGGDGGNGTTSALSGTSTVYGCGGGGGATSLSGDIAGLAGCATAGAGGSGLAAGSNASANSGSGSGGGAASANAGNSGAGIFILRVDLGRLPMVAANDNCPASLLLAA